MVTSRCGQGQSRPALGDNREPGGSMQDSLTCSNRVVGVCRPAWWCYPERCENGHEWGPGLIIVSWTMCDCPPVQAAHTAGAAGLGGGEFGRVASRPAQLPAR
jgi:hypothetical protein